MIELLVGMALGIIAVIGGFLCMYKIAALHNDKKMNELLRMMEKVVPTKIEVLEMIAKDRE